MTLKLSMSCRSLRQFCQRPYRLLESSTRRTIPNFTIPRSSWLHLASLLNRPWFQRIWVIQEVFMVRWEQLFNGSKSIAWSTLAEVAENIVLYDMHSMFASFKLHSPFFKPLCHTSGFKSTDPRDKIYGIVGICESDAMPFESPDYIIPVSKLFVQYAKKELFSGS